MIQPWIYSLIQRVESRARTIEQFRAAGVEPFVHLSDPADIGLDHGTEPGNIKAVKEVIQKVGDNDLLLIEDDVDVHPERFWEAMELATQLNEICYLYTHERQIGSAGFGVEMWLGHILQGKKLVTQAVDMRNAKHIWSAQCIYVPRRYLPGILRDFDDRVAFDSQLRKWTVAKQFLSYAILPAPIQHRNDRTAKDPKLRLRPREMRESITYEYST